MCLEENSNRSVGMGNYRYCQNCGSILPEESYHCIYCGKQIRPKYSNSQSKSQSIFTGKNILLGLIVVGILLWAFNNNSSDYGPYSQSNQVSTQIKMPAPAYALEIGPTHINAYGDDNYNLNDEWVSIKCTKGKVDLGSWSIKDEYGWTFVFPKITLYEGDIVKIYTGYGSNTSSSLYWCKTGAVWNNGGDTLYLYKVDGSLYGSWYISK